MRHSQALRLLHRQGKKVVGHKNTPISALTALRQVYDEGEGSIEVTFGPSTLNPWKQVIRDKHGICLWTIFEEESAMTKGTCIRCRIVCVWIRDHGRLSDAYCPLCGAKLKRTSDQLEGYDSTNMVPVFKREEE
jgi:hypothetical protein